jgi:transposase
MPAKTRETYPEERERIVEFANKGYNSVQIYNKLKFPSERQIRRIVKQAFEQGNVVKKKRAGRPKKTSAKQDLTIAVVTKQNRRLSSRKIAHIVMKEHGINVSAKTVFNRIKLSGAKRIRLKGKPILTKAHKIARYDFAVKHKRANWDLYIFSDEVSIQLFGNEVHVWSWPNEQLVYEKPKKSPSRMFWACFDSNGVSKLIEVSGRINSAKYCKILEDGLLPFLQENSRKNHFFIQDNAPVHKSYETMDWMKKQKIRVVDWPSNSPDLNPIENLWSTLKSRIQQRSPENMTQVVQYAKEEWEKLPASMLKTLSDSMVSRLKIVRKNGGEHTKY